jgi:hypothetical protein
MRDSLSYCRLAWKRRILISISLLAAVLVVGIFAASCARDSTEDAGNVSTTSISLFPSESLAPSTTVAGVPEHPFPRTGAHATLACEDCHLNGSGGDNAAGAEWTKPDPACVSCHGDKHGGLTNCASCHQPTVWADVTFEHSFPRTGAHADLACGDCHVSKPGAESIAGTQFPSADPACVSCHGAQHGGLTECASCHTTEAFKPSTFKHPFARTGAHASLACTKCHGTPFSKAGSTCVSCHGAKHGGLTDCASCHTTKAFKPSTFKHPSVGEHSAGSFACSKCHPNGYATHSCTCHGGDPPTGD